MRVLNDRGVMVYLGRESYLTTAENDPNGLRVVVNGKTAQFTNDEGQGPEQTPIYRIPVKNTEFKHSVLHRFFGIFREIVCPEFGLADVLIPQHGQGIRPQTGRWEQYFCKDFSNFASHTFTG